MEKRKSEKLSEDKAVEGKIRLTDEQRMRLSHHRHLINRMREGLKNVSGAERAEDSEQ